MTHSMSSWLNFFFINSTLPSTLSIIFIFLEACTAGPVTKELASSFVLIIARFISSYVFEQIWLALDKFIFVCKRFKDQILLLEKPLHGNIWSFFCFLFWQSAIKLYLHFGGRYFWGWSAKGPFSLLLLWENEKGNCFQRKWQCWRCKKERKKFPSLFYSQKS